MTFADPRGGPTGFVRVSDKWKSGLNQSSHHSHVLPVTVYNP
jgi:hypothetical protein